VLGYLKLLGVDSAAIAAVEEAEKKATEASKKRPSAQAARWRVDNLKTKIGKLEARSTEIVRQKSILEEETVMLKESVTKARADLEQAEGVLFKAHANEFADPIKVVRAGLDSAVVESADGRAALETLQRLQQAADETKRAEAAAAAAPVAGDAGHQQQQAPPEGVNVPAGDGDSGDIDMGLLEAECFEEKHKIFQEAAERLRAAPPEEQADAKRKYMAAVAALGLGIKRQRLG